MSKVKVLVVEDEVIIADNIADTLLDFGYEVLDPVTSYDAAIDAIEKNKPDIAILDIQLRGRKNGVALASAINETYSFPFIFLTSNSDKITLDEAKKVEPLAYLVKPFNKRELFTSIEVALFNYSKKKQQVLDEASLIIKDSLFIKQNKVFYRLPFKNILFLKSDHVYIEIYVASGEKYTVRGSLNDYSGKLSSSFFRSHRSYIVNLDYLREIDQTSVCIHNESLPLGKKQRDELLKRLNKG